MHGVVPLDYQRRHTPSSAIAEIAARACLERFCGSLTAQLPPEVVVATGGCILSGLGAPTAPGLHSQPLSENRQSWIGLHCPTRRLLGSLEYYFLNGIQLLLHLLLDIHSFYTSSACCLCSLVHKRPRRTYKASLAVSSEQQRSHHADRVSDWNRGGHRPGCTRGRMCYGLVWLSGNHGRCHPKGKAFTNVKLCLCVFGMEDIELVTLDRFKSKVIWEREREGGTSNLFKRFQQRSY